MDALEHEEEDSDTKLKGLVESDKEKTLKEMEEGDKKERKMMRKLQMMSEPDTF
jgi:hypothetical protein